MEGRMSVQTTTNQQLSEATADHYHGSDHGNTTDDPDDLMTSDEERRGGREEEREGRTGERDGEKGGRASDAETLPLDDDDAAASDNSHHHRKRKFRRPDDDNALLLSERHMASCKRYDNGEQQEGVGVKGEEDGWSKDLEAVEEAKRGWETRCVVMLVVLVTTLLILFIFFLFSSQTKAETTTNFRFGNYFSDHMVLQAAPHASVIWGYGPRTEGDWRVVVKVYNAIATTSALPLSTPSFEEETLLQGLIVEAEAAVAATMADNTWKVVIGPLQEGGPFVVTASLIGGEEVKEIRLYDVMVGDVWLCTGHSRHQNSVFEVSNLSSSLKQQLEGEAWTSNNSKNFNNNNNFNNLNNNNNNNFNNLNNNNNNMLRIFSVFPAKSDVPWSDIHVVDIAWSLANIESLRQMRKRRGHKTPHFLATCWFFGKLLQQRLKKAVGVVAATYSDSRLLEWAPVEVAEACRVPYNDASSRIWNGMLHPLLHMPLTGMLWQQAGFKEEGNVLEDTRAHRCLLEGFVQQWRNYSLTSRDMDYASRDRQASRGASSESRASNQLLPLGIIQSLPVNDSSGDNQVAALRWLATGGYGHLPNKLLPGTFLATPIDLPDLSQAVQQQELAERLFKGASHVAYGNKMADDPFPVAWEIMEGGNVKITFNTKIKVRSTEGIEVCCTKTQNQTCRGDRGEHWQRVSIQTDNQADNQADKDIIVSGFSCSRNFLSVRYAWSNVPCPFLQCALYTTHPSSHLSSSSPNSSPSSLHPSSPVPPFIRSGLPMKQRGVFKHPRGQAILDL